MSTKKRKDPHARKMRRVALERKKYTKKEWIKKCSLNPGALKEAVRLNNLSEDELQELKNEIKRKAMDELAEKLKPENPKVPYESEKEGAMYTGGANK